MFLKRQIFISSVYQRSNSCEGAYKRSKSIHRCTQETLLAKNIVRLKHNDSGNGRKKSDDSFLSGTNANYLEELYRLWLQDPKSISESWNEYFKLVQQDEQAKVTESSKIITPASFEIPANLKPLEPIGLHRAKESKRNMSGSELQGDQFIKGTLDLNSTIRAYQTRGHLIADVDPLGIQNPESSKLQGTANLPPAIVVRGHLKGLTEADMNKEFPLGSSTRIGGDKTHLPLREIITRLNKIYCGHLGLEYTYINDLHVLDWLREKFEVPGAWELQPDHRKAVWKDIMRAVTFESFLAKKYGSEKRFGLEGCESFIASTVQVLETSAEKGVESVVMGMAHRGRLSTLVNVCSKPMHQLFIQFNPIPLEGFGSGDVKYHLGTFTQKLLERSKKVISLAIAANPSHLEAVSPCINGRVRAEQVAKNDSAHGVKSLPILVHGDAAFAGQGIVFETMHQTNLPEYTTGGVIHIVINNQVGFTTDPRYSRSSAHCTDVARVVNAPIFHMHGDDPDLVAYCSQVAAEYRSLFHNDVVLDVVGYRRNGHNEMDEPMLTQPLMYKRIKALPNVLTIYTDKLLKDGIITEAFAKEEVSKFLNYCETEFQMSQTISSMQISDWFDIPWSEFFSSQSPNNKIPPTGLEIEEIKLMCDKLVKPPEKIATHPQILRVMSKRETLAKNNEVDWAMGESLAYLSLLKRGHHIRLSGQDVERGTFSHRMHIVHDQNIDLTWKNVLNDVFPKQALYTVSNSPLSEYGVCGFELGYSSYDHNTLTIWEAQFGDFANTCQVILDSFLCSGETKWGRQVGLVLFLPHGMEGQGPEHSSARLERFLQSCDDDCSYLANTGLDPLKGEVDMTRQLYDINWIVCNVTTPANLFHVLRRQLLMPFRKPLIIMSPKSLLRHPSVRSNFDEMGPNTTFKELIPDTVKNLKEVKKIILCSGKVFYELLTLREEKKLTEQIAILRLEQICPFPYSLVAQEIAKYPKSKITWMQEEHKNQGAFYYVRERIANALGIKIEEVKYAGRQCSASPATGSKVIYQNEHKTMMEDAMKLS